MAQQLLNAGSTANDGTGDTLRSGAIKINANFSELYANRSSQLPTQTGNAGLFLATNGATLSWANPAGNAYPSQSGQTGKFLTTNGTSVSWGDVVIGNASTVTNGVYTNGSYADPAWITSLAGSKVTNAVLTTSVQANPAWLTSLAVSKVTDAVSSASTYANPSWITSLAGSKLTGTVIATNGVVTSGTYADPAWITSLASSKISGTIVATNGVVTSQTYLDPAWITSLAETKVLPTQVGQTGKYLTTNGTSSTWATVDAVPSQGGQTGKYLTTDGTTLSWGTPSGTLPSQSGQTGKYLTTDGTTASWSTVAGLVARSTVTATTASLANNANANADITGFKSYALLKIQTSAAAWVRIYSDAASRTADASRASTVDPLPSAGVIAEVITTGAQTILISPGAFGFNSESSPTTTIPVNITNLSGAAAAITATLTVLQLEA